MTDDEWRDMFHRLELRLERVDTKLENLEKALVDFRIETRTRFEGLENRLNTKAGTWVVSLWGGSLAVFMALLRLWH
jgi:hypothetical protein